MCSTCRALVIVCTNARTHTLIILCTHTHMHAHTPLDNIAAIYIVGGVVGGLVVLGIIVLVGLIFGITVAVKLRKKGTSLIIIIAK